jgi:hypothetical protein
MFPDQNFPLIQTPIRATRPVHLTILDLILKRMAKSTNYGVPHYIILYYVYI